MHIKISTESTSWPLTRQTPNADGRWGDLEFHINDPSFIECDYWIVIEGLPEREQAICPPENTVLVTWEPPAIKSYNPRFVAQFASVITCHDLRHRNVIHSQQALQWMIGAKYSDGVWHDFMDFNSLRNCVRRKEKELSVIVSNKQYCNGHRQRINFLNILKKRFGDVIDIFGSGFNPIPDKFDAIYPYKYHIVLETFYSRLLERKAFGCAHRMVFSHIFRLPKYSRLL